MRDLQWAIQEDVPGESSCNRRKKDSQTQQFIEPNVFFGCFSKSFPFSGAIVKGKVGRRTSFEVNVNGSLVHSKLATGGFPDRREVVDIVR